MIDKILKHKIKLIIAVILVTAYYFALPKQLFKDPTSTVIESAEGQLLGAKIASDGQWRFPQNDRVPPKFKACIVKFEDAYFYKHLGFNPISIVKAIVENFKSNKVKRGGSTLTQQVIRLSRKNQKRTYFEKLKELVLATRLEFRYSKEKILSLYASNAPFGGNVVGLDVASWRYFGRFSNELSWAESATLAVLPNAPSLIYPGKNQEQLLQKRNRLLQKLLNEHIIDTLTYQLAIEEALPQKPYRIPQVATHLLQKVAKNQRGEKVTTSIQMNLQQQINAIVKKHYSELSQNQINNMAVLVLDVKTRKVLAYVGNSPTTRQHQKDVDIINKPRSTGSVLKPFLYAAMLDAGDILPNTLVADVPTQIGSYRPENFNKKFDGAVFASEALSRSLNVPAVRMLQSFGLDRFHHYLKALKLTDIKYNANHYGLSLILGGAESNLWDLCKSYASMASTVNHYDDTQGKYYKKEFIEPSYLANFNPEFGATSLEKNIFDAGSIYLTFEALNKVNRPEEEQNWEFFNEANKIAWKTGTSFGFRDAWAIGTTKDFVVGVWVGNADGEGRPGLVGVSTAAPIMFEIFNYLPNSNWFEAPFDELVQIPICSKSGYRAGEYCEQKNTEFVQQSGLKTASCPFHFWVHLDENEEFQVNTSCETLPNIIHKSWFVLPPLMSYYFKKKNPFYNYLPSFRKDCLGENSTTMDFINPKKNTTFYLAKDFKEQEQGIVFKLVHSNPSALVFWYLDSEFIATTQNIHELEMKPKKGAYMLTAIDEQGNEIQKKIEIK
ncbi:penicillin-binding protein 1C [Lutibacter agarilyticus]|uniref:peptidoglycan glycosyltransferase n=1 Tax=Lutibacter agarilyticus TaxID=1109740 RepID=A0A238W3Q6_9FLAO|nr:penicillin-binding protein 1C [Lutibacter agarilyticus]SNR41182.1 penicillin-binding protein 1C [Lutibacter agarilyticus]